MTIIKSLNIFEDVFRPVTLRNGNYFCQLHGIGDEETYNDFLALAASKAEKPAEQTVLLALPLALPTNQLLIDSITEQLPSMAIGDFVHEELTLVNHPETNHAFLMALDIVIPFAIGQERFSSESIRENFIAKLMIWLNQYAGDWQISRTERPRFLCYGPLKKHEAYFLLILAIAGADVVHLSPQPQTVLEMIDTQKLAQILTIGSAGKPLPLKERIAAGVAIEKVTTSAKRATNELDTLLYQGTGMFRPWQFSGGTTSPVFLDAAFEDIETYWNEPARLRTGFKTTGKTVYTPVFFTKLSGVHNDRATYFAFLQRLRSSKLCYFSETTQFPVQMPDQQAVFSLAFCLNEDKTINREAVQKHRLYQPLLTFRNDMQTFLLDKLDELFLRYDAHYFRFPLTDKERVQVIAALFSADSCLLNLIEAYDFPAEIPKLIFYLNGRDIFALHDGLLLGLFHLMGFDIIIFSPNGANNVELVIEEEFINTIRLEEFVQDLPIQTAPQHAEQKKSLFQRIFSR